MVHGKWKTYWYTKLIKTWDIYSSNTTEIIECNSEILACDYRFDGKEIACATLNGQIQIYNPINGSHINSIDIRMDVLGGKNKKFDYFKIKANKSQRLNHFNTINGKCLIGGGNSKYICLYYLPQSLLLKRYITSINKSFEGVLENPNMTKLEIIKNRNEMEKNRDIIKLKRKQLPGVDITDYSSRKRKQIIETKCVIFSPTGMTWAAATSDGLLLYSQYDINLFDPIDLDLNINQKIIKKELINNKSYAKALIMSIKLNDKILIKNVIESIPPKQINICIQTLIPKYFETMLYILSGNIQTTQYLQFYLLWCNKLCIIHAQYLKMNFINYLPHFRLIQKSLTILYKDIAPICYNNIDRLAFLATFGRKNIRKKNKFEEIENDKKIIQPKGEFKPIIFQPLPNEEESD